MLSINMPSVSVIVPSFNSANFISDTLDSVFAQTFADYEVIVVNDGSPDTQQLESVLDPYLQRIIYLKQANRGPAAARNTGIRCARGAFLAFLDSDDMWLPEFLDQQMECLQNDLSVDLIYSDTFSFRTIDPVGTLVGRPSPCRQTVTFENLLTRKSQVVTSCTVVRKQVVLDAGLFDERVSVVEDYDLWLRIACRGGKIVHRPKSLGLRRIHGASLSVDSQKMLEVWLTVLKKVPDSFELTTKAQKLVGSTVREAQAELEMTKGNQYLLTGQAEFARRSFERANEFFRTRKLRMAILGVRTVPWLVAPVAKIWRRFWLVAEFLTDAMHGRLYWTWNRRHLYKLHFRGDDL